MAKNLEGKNCPKFKADATSNQVVSNETYKNKNVVIYFYPKDSTPGCTTEGQEFRDSYKKFKKLNEEIKIRVINDSIRQLKRNYYNLRSRKVVNLIERIEKKNYSKLTLGGCLILKKEQYLLFKKEKS